MCNLVVVSTARARLCARMIMACHEDEKGSFPPVPSSIIIIVLLLTSLKLVVKMYLQKRTNCLEQQYYSLNDRTC